jgi:hypothetical protein
MYIQSFVDAEECARKINEMLEKNVSADFGLEAKALKDDDPRGFYVAIKVPMAEEYPPNGIMRQVADMASPILVEYTDSNKELTFYRPHRDHFVAKLSDVRGKKAALTI